MSVVGPVFFLFVVFFCSGFESSLSLFLCFMTVFVIICISLRCFKEDPCADRYYRSIQRSSTPCLYICLKFDAAASELRVMFRASRMGSSTLQQFFFLLTVRRRFLFRSSSFFVRRCFQMQRYLSSLRKHVYSNILKI